MRDQQTTASSAHSPEGNSDGECEPVDSASCIVREAFSRAYRIQRRSAELTAQLRDQAGALHRAAAAVLTPHVADSQTDFPE